MSVFQAGGARQERQPAVSAEHAARLLPHTGQEEPAETQREDGTAVLVPAGLLRLITQTFQNVVFVKSQGILTQCI